MDKEMHQTFVPALIINGRVEQWSVTPPGKSRRAGIVQLVGDDGYLPFVGFGEGRRQLRQQRCLDGAVCAILAACN